MEFLAFVRADACVLVSIAFTIPYQSPKIFARSRVRIVEQFKHDSVRWLTTMQSVIFVVFFFVITREKIFLIVNRQVEEHVDKIISLRRCSHKHIFATLARFPAIR